MNFRLIRFAFAKEFFFKNYLPHQFHASHIESMSSCIRKLVKTPIGEVENIFSADCCVTKFIEFNLRILKDSKLKSEETRSKLLTFNKSSHNRNVIR